MPESSLRRRLVAYSAAAAAALAVAPTANAVTVYSGTQNIPLDLANQSYNLDIDGDGVDDFFFDVQTDGFPTSIRINPASGNSWIDNYFFRDPALLAPGYIIQNTLLNTFTYYWDNESFDTIVATGVISHHGLFGNETGCIGVRFQTSACGEAFGWIHFSGFKQYGIQVAGTIIDWGYEDVCGTATPACNGSPGGGGGGGQLLLDIPTMGEWGMLALAGLLSAFAIKAINREQEEKS